MNIRISNHPVQLSVNRITSNKTIQFSDFCFVWKQMKEEKNNNGIYFKSRTIFCAFLSIECSSATGCKHKRIIRYSNVLVLNISLLFGLIIIQTLKPRYIAVSIWVEAGACKEINDTFTNVVVIYTQTVYPCPKLAFLV